MFAIADHILLASVLTGAFVQRKLNDYGRSLNVILLARRSRRISQPYYYLYSIGVLETTPLRLYWSACVLYSSHNLHGENPW